MTTVDRIVDQFPADRQAQIRTMLASSLKGVVAQTLCKKKPKGRVAALEVLIGTKAVAALIREGKTHQLMSQMQMGGKVGMRLLNDALLELVEKGVVDPAQAYVKSIEKESFLGMLTRIGVELDLSKLGESAAEAPDQSSPAPESAAPAASPYGSPAPARPAAPPMSPYGGAPTPPPPLPRKPSPPLDPALEEFRMKRGY
jgi:hypothetical protein